jgi:pyruvate dehydrogenase E2 component (dihydrolipoamide acetyltransferase)
MSILVRMPEVLAGVKEAALAAWLVSPGTVVAIGQPIAEIETEKAVVEYESEVAGTVAGFLVELGTPITVGTPIAVLAEAGEDLDDALKLEMGAGASTGGKESSGSAVLTADPGALVSTEAAPTTDEETSKTLTGARIFASPIVRRLVKERQLDISNIIGSGPGGRIVRRDLENLETKSTTERTEVQPAVSADNAGDRVPAHTSPNEPLASGAYVDTPVTPMRRAIARRLVESKSTIPHFYLVADCRVDELLVLRRSVNEKANVKVSLNDFVLKAVAAAFIEFPQANAVWRDDAIRRFDNVDIAVAVAIDDGLVTPVLRDVGARSLTSVSKSVQELATRGREGRLKQHELEGGSFSVSNLGMYGITEFSAIINPPHSGILSVGAVTERPVVVDGEIKVASVMTVTLSGDHRVLDGSLAAQWLSAFVRYIEDPLTLLI